MNKWKALAILFSLFSFGAIGETYRIFTSQAPDITANRGELKIMALILTGLFVAVTIFFWKKASSVNKNALRK